MLSAEVDKLLREAIIADGRFIGEVYLLLEEGLTAQEIAQRKGHKNTASSENFVEALQVLLGKRSIHSLKPSSKIQCIHTAQRILSKSFNSELNKHLEGLLTQSGHPSLNIKKGKYEIVSDEIDQDFIEVQDITGAGVYVYSYPSYLKSLSTNNSELCALYKIGASKNVGKRVDFQRRNTEVPEDLVLVRFYPTEDPFTAEKKIHEVLSLAGLRNQSISGGVEWFKCDIKLIDSLAGLLGLRDSLSIH